MNIVQLINILKDSKICEFLYSYNAEKLLDFGFNGLIKLYKHKNETIETQLIHVLHESYENTCIMLNLECDTESITENFIYHVYKNHNPLSIDTIKEIVKITIQNVEKYIYLNYDVYKIWENEILRSLSNGHDILKNYLLLKNIIENQEIINTIKESNQMIIYDIKAQNKLIKELTNKIIEMERPNLYSILENYFLTNINSILKEE